jgi:hypothetical protein
MRFFSATLILLLALATVSSLARDERRPVKVEVTKTDTGYQLLRGGRPYTIRGAGMSVDHIAAFTAHGGNSIRNWTTGNEPQNIKELLDRADARGVTVMLCLPMQAERWGFDYDDADAVAAQLAAFRTEVLKYRDHPALLAWIIGNELNHGYTNSRVYDADLDFISFQAYGMLFAFPELIEKAGFDKPFLVTEWGAIGYWEVGKTTWGAPIEATSSQKADIFMRANKKVLEQLGGQLLGSYVFYWGQKQERTPTWFGLLTERGEETEAVDVMHYIWNGTWPDNRAPQVRNIRLGGKEPSANVRLKAGKRVKARVAVVDPDGDPLTFHWELKPESGATQVGGDHEESIGSLDGFIEDADSWTARITAPGPGAYRLFVYAYDGQGHAAHANFPFLVTQ